MTSLGRAATPLAPLSILDQFKLMVEGIHDYGIVLLDPSGRVTGWNTGAERIKGYRSEDIVGEPYSRFFTPEDVALGRPSENLRVAGAVGTLKCEGWRVRCDGSRFWASVTITALFDAARELRGFGKLVQDVTEQREAALERDQLMARLEELTRTDELTRLANRHVWDEDLAQACSDSRRRGSAPSVAVLDLDSFKAFNDEFGHAAGDKLLRETAACWRPAIRSGDTLARFGGDEFACVFPSCPEATAVGIVNRMRDVTPGRMTVSVGVACWDGRESEAQLFDRADRALYAAKRQGRDRVSAKGSHPVAAG